MKRKLALLLLVWLFMFSVVSCTKNSAVSSISINSSSFKFEYAIDEKINYNTAFITLHYSNGKTAKMRLTPDMIVGFDSTTTGFGKVLTVSYLEFTSTFIYNVKNSYDILTSTRLKAEVIAEKIFLSLKPLNDFSYGVFGVNFRVSGTFSSIKLLGTTPFAIEYSQKDNICEVVVYSLSGDPFTSTENFIELVATASISSLNITNIIISDGYNDINLPNIII